MTGAPKAAAPKKGAAARREAQDTTPTVEFRGLTFELEKELPGELIFDLAALEHEETPGGIVGLLTSLLGADQVAQVRAKFAEDKVAFAEAEDVLGDLLGDILGEYGLTPGESSASQDS